MQAATACHAASASPFSVLGPPSSVLRPLFSVLFSPSSVLCTPSSVFRPPSSVSARHLPAERERERWCPVWGPVTDWPYLGSGVLEDLVEVIQHGAGAVGHG